MIKQTLNRSILLALTVFVFNPHIIISSPQQVGPVKVSLLSAYDSVKPGMDIELGLYIEPDEDWHVYWKNPGDAGLPPVLKWNLPDNFSVTDIHYPKPERIDLPPLTSYGYHGAVLYPVTVSIPEDYNRNEINIQLSADWLVCKLECLPGKAVFTLTLPVSNNPTLNTNNKELFDKTRSHIPKDFPADRNAQVTLTDSEIYLDIKFENQLSDSVSLEFFASEKAIINHAFHQSHQKINDTYRLKLERSAYSASDSENLNGVLVVADNNKVTAYNISIPISNQTKTTVAATNTKSDIGIMLSLLFAFLGGLILNLMPCVLPVLSLKVLGLINQATEGRRSSFMHGLFFTFGVVMTFWVIVAVMFILQAGGAQLGWGFQLQSPTFVLILATGMFLFGLSLFGLFEVSFLTGTASALSSNKSSGLSSAFVSGITATLVATPCTAPFMGAALGFSLTQPIIVSFLIYTALAIGMASPYLFLAIFPNLLKFVPKPGRWMETFKQAMGFLLMATVIWLGWVLSSLSGSNALVILLGVLLFVSIGAWIYGRYGSFTSSKKSRLASGTIAFVVICSSILFGHEGINRFQTTVHFEQSDDTGINWEKFSQSKLDDLLTQGKPVFLDFTAAWCLSCQVNEQVAFSSDEVVQKFKELDITPIKADWTNRSDEITKALASFGRNSVPLYVLYSPDKSASPIILPEILTEGIVLDALSKMKTMKSL